MWATGTSSRRSPSGRSCCSRSRRSSTTEAGGSGLRVPAARRRTVVRLERALELAERGRGAVDYTHPLVGAVVVRDGEVVGEGWYAGRGTPHGEVVALRAAGERARGATLYVTLEPCSHRGDTPPCADAVVEAGIARVVAGGGDANTKVDGKGFERLRAAGVDVEVVDSWEARVQNETWRVWT